MAYGVGVAARSTSEERLIAISLKTQIEIAPARQDLRSHFGSHVSRAHKIAQRGEEVGGRARSAALGAAHPRGEPLRQQRLAVDRELAHPHLADDGVARVGLQPRLADDPRGERDARRRAAGLGGAELDQGFKRAAANIPNIDVLPIQGINVYDILRRGTLVLSKAAVEALEERFK